jgi:hypothetical protein
MVDVNLKAVFIGNRFIFGSLLRQVFGKGDFRKFFNQFLLLIQLILANDLLQRELERSETGHVRDVYVKKTLQRRSLTNSGCRIVVLAQYLF